MRRVIEVMEPALKDIYSGPFGVDMMICTNPAFRQSMSNKDISMFMEALGFKKIHRKTGNGWKVIEMRPDEIENNQKMDGSENIPPEDLPF